MAAVRRADVAWNGQAGKGVVTGQTSGAFKQLEVSFPNRIGEAEGKTSPEELLAASHASCYAMALSAGLGRQQHPPERLDVSAEVTFDRVGEGFAVTSSRLEVHGKVPGIDQAAFQQAAEAAKDGCPISKALKGNVELSVKATLES